MKYSKKRALIICEMIATGNHTIAEICKKVDIHKDTFFDWKNNKPDFSDLLKKAQEDYMESIKIKARSGLAVLLEKHEFEETKIEYIEGKPDGTGVSKPKIKSQTKTKRVIMPSITAIIYTLNNSDKDNFKQRQSVEHTGENGDAIKTETLIKVGYGNKNEDPDTED